MLLDAIINCFIKAHVFGLDMYKKRDLPTIRQVSTLI